MAKFIETLKDLGVPRIVLIIFVVAGTAATVMVATSAISFTVGYRAEDISNRLASMQTAIGELKATLAIDLPPIKHQIEILSYRTDALTQSVTGLETKLNEHQIEVGGAIAGINKDRATARQEFSARLATLEADGAALRSEIDRLGNKFDGWLLQHHAELGAIGPVSQERWP